MRPECKDRHVVESSSLMVTISRALQVKLLAFKISLSGGPAEALGLVVTG